MIYFTSDLHCYHRRIQEFCPTTRKGKDWEEMTEIILSNMEKTLVPGDVLYNLGDVAFQGVDFCRRTLQRIGQMGVEHHLILGNHDHHIRKNSDLQDLCSSVSHMKTIFVEKQMLVLCHFPMAHWESEETSFHLHGHCHGSFKTDGNILDVGIDNRAEADMMPWSWDEIKRHMKTVKPKIGHHGAD
jgi:calcineurin-like phosphoesterase family protein